MHVTGRRMMRVGRLDDGRFWTIFEPDVARAIENSRLHHSLLSC